MRLTKTEAVESLQYQINAHNNSGYGTGNRLNSRTLCSNCGSELHETELFLRNWPLLSLSNIFPILYNPQVHFCVQKNTPLDHIHSHVNSVHIAILFI